MSLVMQVFCHNPKYWTPFRFITIDSARDKNVGTKHWSNSCWDLFRHFTQTLKSQLRSDVRLHFKDQVIEVQPLRIVNFMPISLIAVEIALDQSVGQTNIAIHSYAANMFSDISTFSALTNEVVSWSEHALVLLISHKDDCNQSGENVSVRDSVWIPSVQMRSWPLSRVHLGLRSLN